MALIGKNNIKNAFVPWPNPFGLKDSDAKGMLEGYPLEIITLAMKRFDEYHSFVIHKIERLQSFGLSFLWRETKEGWDFWNSIDMKNYDVFYDKYTLKSLAEELKKNKIKWREKKDL